MGKHLKGVALFAILLAFGTAFGAASEFEVTDAENGQYDGKVKPGGDGYALTAEDSARYYNAVNIYDDLLVDGTQCGGITNSYMVNVGTYAWSPVSVVLPHGPGTGKVLISVNATTYPGTGTSAASPVIIDLNGEEARGIGVQLVNGVLKTKAANGLIIIVHRMYSFDRGEDSALAA